MQYTTNNNASPSFFVDGNVVKPCPVEISHRGVQVASISGDGVVSFSWGALVEMSEAPMIDLAHAFARMLVAARDVPKG